MNNGRVKILLGDSQEVVRAGLRALLEAHAGWFVCGEAADGAEAVRLAAVLRPDVAILDLEMNSGIEATRRIKLLHHRTEVVTFTSNDDEFKIREALAAGARAFVLKSEGAARLIEAVDCVSNHRPCFAAPAAETLLKSFLFADRQRNDSCRLTTRQSEIVRLLTTGSSNKQVAAALGISIKTVETHRAAIMRRLGFRSIANLVRYAVRARVIKP